MPLTRMTNEPAGRSASAVYNPPVPTRQTPPTRLQEAISVCRSLLTNLERGGRVTASVRQAARLGDVLDDKFITTYCQMLLSPGLTVQERRAALAKVQSRRDPEASGIFRFFEDFTLSGPSLGSQLAKAGGNINLSVLKRSLPEAETFVASARKRVRFTYGDQSLLESVTECELVIDRVNNRLHRYATSTLYRLLFEEIPERVLNDTRRKVDAFLAAKCPSALEKFGVAHEELVAQSSENWTNACTGVRRILLDVADALFPATTQTRDGRKLGPADYKNRLWAYAKDKITSESQQATLVAELDDVGARIDAIYAQSSKGVHAVVTRDEAERLIVRTYLLIADLI